MFQTALLCSVLFLWSTGNSVTSFCGSRTKFTNLWFAHDLRHIIDISVKVYPTFYSGHFANLPPTQELSRSEPCLASPSIRCYDREPREGCLRACRPDYSVNPWTTSPTWRTSLSVGMAMLDLGVGLCPTRRWPSSITSNSTWKTRQILGDRTTHLHCVDSWKLLD